MYAPLWPLQSPAGDYINNGTFLGILEYLRPQVVLDAEPKQSRCGDNDSSNEARRNVEVVLQIGNLPIDDTTKKKSKKKTCQGPSSINITDGIKFHLESKYAFICY